MEPDVPQPGALPSTQVHKTIEPRIDLTNLLCEDLQTIDKKSKLTNTELQALARDNVQCVLNELWKLPTKRVEDAVVVALPASSSIRLPREKPLPKPRAPSKWQQYAAAKGIQKRNKSKLVWDEVTQTWKPRWGYRSAGNDRQQDWLIEVPQHGDPNKDYFAAKSDAKRERVAKNEMQRIRNITRSTGTGANAMPLYSGIGMNTNKKTAQDISRQLDRARQSTASVGKFTPTIRDETLPKNRGKKRQFAPNEVRAKDEREKQLQLIGSLGKKKPKIDEQRAIAQEHVASEREPTSTSDTGKKHKQPMRSQGKKKRQQFHDKKLKKGKTARKSVKSVKGGPKQGARKAAKRRT